MIFDTPWGPVGLCICYDTYCFPEMSRYFAAMGCRMQINCTAYAKCHGDFIARSTTESYAGIDEIVGPSLKYGGFGIDYYAGYPFADPAGYVNTMYTATLDLAMSAKKIFNSNPGIGGMTDYRPSLYIKMLEKVLATHTEYKED